MDRFIVQLTSIAYIFLKYLKSNMDRFIETSVQIINVNAFI